MRRIGIAGARVAALLPTAAPALRALPTAAVDAWLQEKRRLRRIDLRP